MTMTDDDKLTNNVPIEPIVRQEPRRSKRVIRPPVRLTLSEDIYLMESEALDDDPFTYQEAIIDNEKLKMLAITEGYFKLNWRLQNKVSFIHAI